MIEGVHGVYSKELKKITSKSVNIAVMGELEPRAFLTRKLSLVPSP